MRVEQALCFKCRRRVAKYNTVRFQLHTLQSLPGQERTGYASAAVEALDGRLSVRREGRIITTQEAPPSLLLLRIGHGGPQCSCCPLHARGLGEDWGATLESPDSRPEDNNGHEMIADDDTVTAKPAGTFARKPTILQPSSMGEMEASSDSHALGDVAASN